MRTSTAAELRPSSNEKTRSWRSAIGKGGGRGGRGSRHRTWREPVAGTRFGHAVSTCSTLPSVLYRRRSPDRIDIWACLGGSLECSVIFVFHSRNYDSRSESPVSTAVPQKRVFSIFCVWFGIAKRSLFMQKYRQKVIVQTQARAENFRRDDTSQKRIGIRLGTYSDPGSPDVSGA